MQPYSLGIRTGVVAVGREPGARQADGARRFAVSVPFLKKLPRQQRKAGSLAPKPARGGRARRPNLPLIG